MTQDKDQMRAEFEQWACPQADKNAIAKFENELYMSAKTSMAWAAWQAARASAPQGVQKAGWWRKRADEIELEVARTGSKEAMRCFTDMRTLLQAAAAPQGVPMNVRIAMQSALEGSSDALFEAGKDNKDAEAALDWLAAAPQPVDKTPELHGQLVDKIADLQRTEPSDDDLLELWREAVHKNQMAFASAKWFARALLQRYGGHGLSDDLVWCDCGDGYAKGTDEAIHIASGQGCSNCEAGTKPEPTKASRIALPPAPHKMGDVELWPRSLIEQHVAERTADLEQASRYSADLFKQAEKDWRKDAERWKFAISDSRSDALKWIEVYRDWDGQDSFVTAIDAAMAAQKDQA